MELSIIIPTYNCGHLIERTIRSILVQNLSNYEIIIVDDNSSDNTEDVVKNLNCKEIAYYKFNENHGVSHARNFGISHSSGKYIVFCDSDDEQANDCCTKLLETTKRGYDFVVSDYTIIENNNSRRITIDNYDKESIDDIQSFIKIVYTNDLFNSPVNKIYKRSIIEENNLSFDESISLGEDYRFNLDYINKINNINKVYYLSESLYLYYRGTQGLSLRKTANRIPVKIQNWYYHLSYIDYDFDYMYRDYLKIITLGLAGDKNIVKQEEIKNQLIDIRKKSNSFFIKMYSWILIHFSKVMYIIIRIIFKITKRM